MSSSKGARVRAAAIITLLLFISFQACSGRIIRRDEVRKTREITIASYTANSWFGWGNPVPDADELAFDLLSTAIYQGGVRGLKLDEVNRGFGTGDFAPGKTAAAWGTAELEKMIRERNISASTVKLGKNPLMGFNPSPVALSAQLLATLTPALPENARPVVDNIGKYALAADPQGKSSPDGMPLVQFNDLDAPGLKELIVKSPKDGAVYMAISGVYRKGGYTVMGNGSGDISCTLKAVIYDSAARPIWRTEVDGTGGSFTSALYFAPVWSDVEGSAKKATSHALAKLAKQIGEDFPKRAR
jgi:hypothetical protein